MESFGLRRRRSDAPNFLQTNLDVDVLAQEIFSRYVGEQRILIDGTPSTATFFRLDYCPEFRVMKLAGLLALAINQAAGNGSAAADELTPMRVTVNEIMLAALMHDLGKLHEDCAPFIELLKQTDLRTMCRPDSDTRQEYLLSIIRDVHCRKGPCMIDRLGDAGRPELSNPFIGTVARRHGDDYEVNRGTKQGCWWASEINVVTIADDFDAMTSAGPERAYKPANLSLGEAAALLWKGVERGRYASPILRVFIEQVLALDLPRPDAPHQPTA
jgi:hypothetical protein